MWLLAFALGGAALALALLGVLSSTLQPAAAALGGGALLAAFAYGALRTGSLLHGIVLLTPVLPLAAYAGAALGLVPLPRVQEAIESGVLTDDLTENFNEFVNVMASVFNENPEAPHLKLYKVHAVGEKLPSDVASSLGYVVRRLDLRVEVSGYGAGRLSSVSIG